MSYTKRNNHVERHDGHQIRTRLLNRLGIVDVPASSEVITAKRAKLHPRLIYESLHHKTTSKSSLIPIGSSDDLTSFLVTSRRTTTTATRSEIILSGARRYFAKLRALTSNDIVEEETKLCCRCRNHSDSVVDNQQRSLCFCCCTKKRVHFAEYVYVLEIPNRHSYLEEERTHIWNNRQEILDMARKNEKEFFYEKYDIANVVEEQDFVDVNSVMVHPAHIPAGYLTRKESVRCSLYELAAQNSYNTTTSNNNSGSFCFVGSPNQKPVLQPTTTALPTVQALQCL